MVKEMVENEIKLYVQELDEKGECLRELFKCVFDMGFYMFEIFEEYGGIGLSYEIIVMIFEELVKVDVGYVISFVIIFVVLRNVIFLGIKEQGKYFVYVIGKGNFVGFVFIELNVGFDFVVMRGIVVKDGEDYILNVIKIFIINGVLVFLFVGFFKI